MERPEDCLLVDMARFFDERASTYDDHQRQTVAYFESVHRTAAGAVQETSEEVRVLDLGCGTGIELEGILARAPNAQITCIDVSGGMLDELKRKYRDSLPQVEVIKCSFLDMPFRQAYYEYAVSVLSMHHLTYRGKLNLYARIRKALACGGQYIEGDHVLPREEEKERLEWYRQQLAAGVVAPDGLYHIDIPSSVATQREVLLQAGFTEVRLLLEEEYAAVLCAC